MDSKIFNFREYCKNRCKNEKKIVKKNCEKNCENLLIDFFEKIADKEKNQEIIFRILRS